MIDPHLEELWQHYLDVERSHVRSEMLPALGAFIERLLQRPEEEWRAWALDTARLVADEAKELPIRHPLFRHVLLPALISGVRQRECGCARWLAHFNMLLYHCPEVKEQLPESLQTPVGLLEEALRLDPADALARKRLISTHADYLQYTLHELPSGVLYGTNGATADECEELLELLADFNTHVALAGLCEHYEDLIAECTFHFAAYREYRAAGCPGGSYEIYVLLLKGK